MKVVLVLASVMMLATAAPQYPNSVGGYSGSSGGGGLGGALGGLDIAQLLAAVTRQSQAAAQAPRSNYGAPSSSSSGSSQYAAPPSTQYGPGGNNGLGGGSGSGGGLGGGSGLGGGNGLGGGSGLGGGPGGLDNGLGGGDGSGAGAEQQVHKHVYVHVAPSEAPEPKAPKAPSAPQIPEKHYKILFIRAPEPAPYEQPDISDLPPAPEQKTLVYVLLKKPDATPAITLPTQAPTKPSKPEVYFIRYKSPENNDAGYGAPNAGGNPLGGGGGSGSGAGSDVSSQYGAPSRSGY